ncbi:beta-ketoacyl-ACP synthase III [Phenylobacterium sp.]|uniref:beta-ketoacyl-ACP synthase III n=1 Tax=Phenylobacterium sp. TaxID=1871053 RepID=UPI0025EAE273|nr:beta-ketoacyl-ACP synthase III [Phenylobacterium sp.]MCA6287512.1 beta-ketoacyl-ACP synthase III [Phenylobacterium sp.]MCA6289110.1 beta-ketoacyl-ACP synthase III [Phenylobacterium sp.]MCA6311757.1 beta-ketoacyl-ACP synthase III [Phenylobacterium sp.]MCA6324894.1 beta-ketoacyl-ACP synthase III [Phenylobacterium sp.]MCA6338534.1 beta-ketoacyl-ACP synthase III [Phenylobacterium sp.]
MHDAVIAATGLFTPAERVTNAELVEAFNAFVEIHNARNADTIAAGEMEALAPSSVEFIEKASGIKSRYVMNRSGVVDPEVMHPLIPERSNDELSVMAEIGVAAAKDAIARWGKDASQIDAVVCAASNMQRAYPAMAIEIQQALGIEGFGFDMNVACSSATFGIKTAADYIATGSARAVLVVNPEITSGHLNFCDRDSHFIFGDVATAVIVERADQASGGWDILGTRLMTVFSNNIRNNFGFLNRTAPGSEGAADKLFVQEGRKVFREVVPMVAEMIVAHAADLGIDPTALKRLWLHQANINMNDLIGRRVLGRDPTPEENVIILDEFANTSSAGSIIAFHRANADFASGETGLICSFGAGYSAGTVFVRRR